MPPDVEQLIAIARAEAYLQGHNAALGMVADGIAELDILVGPTWRAEALETTTERRARERAEREARAAAREAANNIYAGRDPDWRYTGQSRGGSGAVCWETGYPVETANQWLNRPRWMPLPTTTARWIPAPLPGVLATVTELRPTRRHEHQEAA